MEVKPIQRVDKPNGLTIEELIMEFTDTTNPVTRSVLKDIIIDRLHRATKTNLLQ